MPEWLLFSKGLRCRHLTRGGGAQEGFCLLTHYEPRESPVIDKPSHNPGCRLSPSKTHPPPTSPAVDLPTRQADQASQTVRHPSALQITGATARHRSRAAPALGGALPGPVLRQRRARGEALSPTWSRSELTSNGSAQECAGPGLREGTSDAGRSTSIAPLFSEIVPADRVSHRSPSPSRSHEPPSAAWSNRPRNQIHKQMRGAAGHPSSA